jgi:hypothetical protein
VLQTYEAFVLRCSKDVASHLSAIIEISLKFLSFDPNFAGDEDDVGSGSESGFSGSDEEVNDQKQENLHLCEVEQNKIHFILGRCGRRR